MPCKVEQVEMAREWKCRYEQASVVVQCSIDHIVPVDVVLHPQRMLKRAEDLEFLTRMFHMLADGWQLGMNTQVKAGKDAREWKGLRIGGTFPTPPPEQWKDDWVADDLVLSYVDDEDGAPYFEWLTWCSSSSDFDYCCGPY